MTTKERLRIFKEETRKLEKRYNEVNNKSKELNERMGRIMDNDEFSDILGIIRAKYDINIKFKKLMKEATVLKYLIDNNIEIMDEVDSIGVN